MVIGEMEIGKIGWNPSSSLEICKKKELYNMLIA